MRILLLNQYFAPDVAASAQRVTELAEDLATVHDVTAIVGRPSYGKGDEGRMARPARPGLRVRRVFSTTFRRARTWRRVANYLTYLVSASVAALAGRKPDVVIAATDPPLVAALGAAIARVRRVPYACLLWDVQPHVAVEAGLIRPGGLSRLLERATCFALRRADAVVVPTADMARTAIALGAREARVVVHTHWEDPATVAPLPRDNAFARAHRLAGRFVVMYSGNLGLTQQLDRYVDLAGRLRDIDATLLFVGDGAGRERLLERAREAGGDVRVLPYQPRDTMPESLAAADVFLVPLGPGLTRFMLPSKVYTMMASARPIVAAIDVRSDVAAMVGGTGAGVVVAPGDLDAIEAHLRRLHAHPDVRTAMGQAGRRAILERFSREAVTAQYLAWLGQFEAAGAP